MRNKISEKLFILELCKINTYRKDILIDLMRNSLDYPYILGQLLFHRVGGVAYLILGKCEILSQVNREFRNVLQTMYLSGKEKANSFVKTMEYLSDIIKHTNFPYAVLKGGLLVSIYEKGLRTSNDFDFLIKVENILEFSNVLKENGFTQGHIRGGEFKPASRSEIVMSRMNRGETVPYIKKINLPSMKYCEVDINFSLDFKPNKEDDVISSMLNHTEPNIKLDKGNLQTLNNIDFLIHLCVHLYKEATVINWVKMGRDVSLYKYIDIDLVINLYMDKPYAEKLAKQIKQYGLERECYYALYYTKELLKTNNKELEILLNIIKPQNIDFLCQVIAPESGKVYKFDEDYMSWVFCSNRGERLYEVTDEKA